MRVARPAEYASGSPKEAVKTRASIRRSHERRSYVRARLALCLSVRRIAGQPSATPHTGRVHDISSSGAFFLYPTRIDAGTPLALEIALIEERPRHRSVRMCADAHVVRTEAADTPGWHGLAVAFDDIRFVRSGNGVAASARIPEPNR